MAELNEEDDRAELMCPEKRIKLSSQEPIAEIVLVKDTPETVDTVTDRGKVIETPPLPEDWVSVRHVSGVNLYFHKPTRTCSISRPYIISEKRTVKKHRVPVDAIPCLKEWLFCDNKSSLALEWHKVSEKQFGQLVVLEPHRIEEYTKLRWPHGMTDTSQRSVERPRKVPSKKKDPEKAPVPDNLSKLVDIKVPKCYRIANSNGKTSSAIWRVNSLLGAVSLLYEFCEHYLRSELEFISQETDDTNSPYLCIATIGGTQYGRGTGTSKKIAKRQAAYASLQLFLPDFSSQLSSAPKPVSNSKYDFLSTISITDPVAPSILAGAGLPSPWNILRECHQRNKGCGYIQEPILTMELRPVEDQHPLRVTSSDPSIVTDSLDALTSSSSSSSNSTAASSVQSWYQLKCGERLQVSGPCSGKKTGQHLAAQAMLKLIHPHILTWDQLLKLYGNTNTAVHARVIEERTEVNILSHLSQSENSELLVQLRNEMRKLS